MTIRFTLLATIALAGFLLVTVAKAADAPINNAWDRKVYDYVRPAKLIVEETTPTNVQIAFFIRAPAIPADAPDPKATGPAIPLAVGDMNIVHLQFKDATGDQVPALLATPRGKTGPFPVVIATHGLMSNKVQVLCLQVGPALMKQGFAVLAADLPCHGERPGNPLDMVNPKDGDKLFDRYKKAIIDIHQLIDLAEDRPELNTKNGVVLVGYSLGSWMSAVAGPSDDRVKAMVLMVGGAFDFGPAVKQNPNLIAVDPRLSIAHFAGRPLLLLNGKTDGIVKPDSSKRLYDACPEPKKQVWYDSGHLLPAQAFEDAAKWIRELPAEAAAKDKKPK